MYACFVQKLFKCVPAQRGRSHSSQDYFLIYLNFFFPSPLSPLAEGTILCKAALEQL